MPNKLLQVFKWVIIDHFPRTKEPLGCKARVSNVHLHFIKQLKLFSRYNLILYRYI